MPRVSAYTTSAVTPTRMTLTATQAIIEAPAVGLAEEAGSTVPVRPTSSSVPNSPSSVPGAVMVSPGVARLGPLVGAKPVGGDDAVARRQDDR